MCIICTGDYVGLNVVDCSECKNVTEIPVIPGLKELSCWGCPNLTKIPAIPGLKVLDCSYCVNLKEIPVIPGLINLVCHCSRSLIEIPIISGSRNIFRDCPWLKYNEEFERNISYLVKIQRIVRKYHKLKICKRWVESDDFRHWYYHPEGPGGIKAVLRLKERTK